MLPKDSKTHSLTYGAMIIAIFGVLLLVNRQTGSFFEEIFLYIFPIPMVAYSAIYGWKKGLPVFVGMCLISFLCGTMLSVFYAISQAFIGLVFGTALNHKRDMTRTLLMVMLLSTVANLLSTVVLASLFGFPVAGEVTAMRESMMDAMQKAMDISGGAGGAQGAQTMQALETLLSFDYLKRMFIISMVILGALQGYIVYVLSLLILKRLKFPVEQPKPLLQYYPPKWLGYIALALFAIYYITTARPLAKEAYQDIAQTVGMLGYAILLIFGLIAVNQAIKAYLTPNKIVAILLTIVAMLILPLVLLLVGYLYISGGLHTRILEKTQENKRPPRVVHHARPSITMPPLEEDVKAPEGEEVDEETLAERVQNLTQDPDAGEIS